MAAMCKTWRRAAANLVQSRWLDRVEYGHSTPGVGLISPHPHHDIYSIEDLAFKLIFDFEKMQIEKQGINVKLFSSSWCGKVAAGVAKGHGDVILDLRSQMEATGASPAQFVRHASFLGELWLSEAHQTLVQE